MNAAFYNNLELVPFAIENGANINHQDSIGFSALHFAAQEQHVESIHVLLTHNSSIDLQDKYGNSALWRAVMNDVSVEVIEILLTHGAKAKLQNYSEVAPIDLIDEDNAEMVHLFNHYSSIQT